MLKAVAIASRQRMFYSHGCCCMFVFMVFAFGKRDSLHHHLLEAVSETANVLELRQKLLYTTPSGWWWWCIESVFRVMLCFLSFCVYVIVCLVCMLLRPKSTCFAPSLPTLPTKSIPAKICRLTLSGKLPLDISSNQYYHHYYYYYYHY